LFGKFFIFILVKVRGVVGFNLEDSLVVEKIKIFGVRDVGYVYVYGLITE